MSNTKQIVGRRDSNTAVERRKKAMLNPQYVIDNRDGNTAAEYLKKVMRGATDLSIVSAYFSVHGFDLVKDEIQQIDRVRFLYGDRSSIAEVDPSRETKSFALEDGQLTPNQVLEQSGLARACKQWVSKKEVEIRAIERANFLHGKMYLGQGEDERALVGSSNFTRSGLGYGIGGNIEINLGVKNKKVLEELRQWFDDIWGSDLTRDVKADVLAELKRLGKRQSPRDVYYKTLYEVFREEIENGALAESADRTGTLKASRIWNKLYQFQKDGAETAISRLEEYGGCILADSVGLGKTFTALAVVKYYELRNKHVLVMCPKKVMPNWERFPSARGYADNELRDDRFNYTVKAHTDLSRDEADFDWRNYDLIVIDESHNFRNRLGQRYRRLLEEAIQAGSRTDVLMLSATPVNTAVEDLGSQVGLMNNGDQAALARALDVSDIKQIFREAGKRFDEWQNRNGEPASGKSKFIEQLSPEFRRVLDQLSIARSRRHISEYYEAEIERVGRFPERLKPRDYAPRTDLNATLSYSDMADRIAELTLALYFPTDYQEDADASDQQTQKYLVGMMKVNFLKRLESSARALDLTLGRTIRRINNVLEKVEELEARRNSHGPTTTVELDASDTDDELDETATDDVLAFGKIQVDVNKLDLRRWRADLRSDRDKLLSLKERVSLVTPERDGKLAQLIELLHERHANPTKTLSDPNSNGSTIVDNRKLLVFTTFKDTAVYLYDQLLDLAQELGVTIGMVAGDQVRVSSGKADFGEVLGRFAPKGNNRTIAANTGEIDLLIATDCIAEGQNLQDCDRIVNYDIHWNPVRLIQRFGRIDRIGSRAQDVQMSSFWPTDDMDEQLRLRKRVLNRAVVADLAATADDDLLVPNDELQEDTYRHAQLLRMRTSNVDLEDLDDVVTLSDLSLDQFRAQLADFLKANEKTLSEIPLGVYAVVDPERQDKKNALGSGVIWCLRKRNAELEDGTTMPSVVHPYYLVCIKDDGTIHYGCDNAENVLRLFRDMCADVEHPDDDLHDDFDAETDHGTEMTRYDALLTKGTGHIRAATMRKTLTDIGFNGDPNVKIPVKRANARAESEFELVTWLVVRN